jgi:hypothetical protein
MDGKTLVFGRSRECTRRFYNAVGEGSWILRRDERSGFQCDFGGNTRRRTRVIQIRGQDLSPETLGSTLVDVLRGHASALLEGAILTMDVRNARVRRLPLR